MDTRMRGRKLDTPRIAILLVITVVLRTSALAQYDGSALPGSNLEANEALARASYLVCGTPLDNAVELERHLGGHITTQGPLGRAGGFKLSVKYEQSFAITDNLRNQFPLGPASLKYTMAGIEQASSIPANTKLILFLDSGLNLIKAVPDTLENRDLLTRLELSPEPSYAGCAVIDHFRKDVFQQFAPGSRADLYLLRSTEQDGSRCARLASHLLVLSVDNNRICVLRTAQDEKKIALAARVGRVYAETSSTDDSEACRHLLAEDAPVAVRGYGGQLLKSGDEVSLYLHKGYGIVAKVEDRCKIAEAKVVSIKPLSHAHKLLGMQSEAELWPPDAEQRERLIRAADENIGGSIVILPAGTDPDSTGVKYRGSCALRELSSQEGRLTINDPKTGRAVDYDLAGGVMRKRSSQ